jgi:TRAP-type uncharacterized transport system fused permease subunit
MADLTPPVALAAFAAAPIAKESGFKIGFQALKIAMAGFVIPFMAVYDPALMLQPVQGLSGFAYTAAATYIIVKALLAIFLWGAATIGFMKRDLTIWERLLAAAAAFSLVLALPLTDEAGFMLAAVVIGQHLWRARAAAAPA